jgi:hypothetical protein
VSAGAGDVELAVRVLVNRQPNGERRPFDIGQADSDALCQVPGLMETIKPGGTSMVAPRLPSIVVCRACRRLILSAACKSAQRDLPAGLGLSRPSAPGRDGTPAL